MKKEYEKPEIMIKEINFSDIIVTSGNGNDESKDENWTPFEPNQP